MPDETDRVNMVRRAVVAGDKYLALVTELLQRARIADDTAGLWEAADLQWWWRKPRRSDDLGQVFWFDDAGPIAAVVLTAWGDQWQCDPILLPVDRDRLLEEVWATALAAIADVDPPTVRVPVRLDDLRTRRLMNEAGFEPPAGSDDAGVMWMAAPDRVAIPDLPTGYRLVDREVETHGTHWLAGRNGPDVEGRLRQCSLYRPDLDLAVIAPDQSPAAYGLFWSDPVTGVGLVEPMRTEDSHQRRGLARAVLATGQRRMAELGCRRFKIGYASEPAFRLYAGMGFTPEVTTADFERRG